MSSAGYRFRIRAPKESRSSTLLSPWIELPFLPNDALDDDVLGSCSCAGRAWQSYFEALESSNVRHLPMEAESHPRGRFLSVPLNPFPGTIGTFHTPLGAQRLSNVMKNVMKAAGVDTSVYKGGSGRSAGSSAADGLRSRPLRSFTFAYGSRNNNVAKQGIWTELTSRVPFSRERETVLPSIPSRHFTFAYGSRNNNVVKQVIWTELTMTMMTLKSQGALEPSRRSEVYYIIDRLTKCQWSFSE